MHHAYADAKLCLLVRVRCVELCAGHDQARHQITDLNNANGYNQKNWQMLMLTHLTHDIQGCIVHPAT